MKEHKELIPKIAELARLKLTHEEENRFVKDFTEILKAFSALSKCDTKGITVRFHPVELKNQMREDLIEDSLSQKQALENTEHKKDGYFKGPRAV